MAVSFNKKEDIVKELNEILKNHPYVYFVDFANAKTLALTAFKKAILALGARHKVVKKNLLKIALRENKMEFPGIDDYAGSFAVVYTKENEIEVAKAVDGFIKENNPKVKTRNSLSILAAIFGKTFMPKTEAQKLAKIPSKEVLRGQLVNVLISPISGLAHLLTGTIQNLLLTLKEIERAKQ